MSTTLVIGQSECRKFSIQPSLRFLYTFHLSNAELITKVTRTPMWSITILLTISTTNLGTLGRWSETLSIFFREVELYRCLRVFIFTTEAKATRGIFACVCAHIPDDQPNIHTFKNTRRCGLFRFTVYADIPATTISARHWSDNVAYLNWWMCVYGF